MVGLIFQKAKTDGADDRMSERYDGTVRDSAKRVVVRVQVVVMAQPEPPPSCSCLLGVEANESNSRDSSVALESGDSPCSMG